MHQGKPICYHSETFTQAMINYATYDKELYSLVQSLKKWKHYLVGKEKILHIDHQLLQYLYSQAKLQQSWHFRWMGFLQQFHLVIKYQKDVQNKVADILSRPVVNTLLVMKNTSLAHDSYAEQYVKVDDFKEVYDALTKSVHNEGVECHLHNNILYHLSKLCVPRDERVNVIRETNTSLIYGHFRVGKIVAQLQRYS